MDKLLRLVGTVHEGLGSYQALETPHSLIMEEQTGWPDWVPTEIDRATTTQEVDGVLKSEIYSPFPSK
jgi:hypothetical protein